MIKVIIGFLQAIALLFLLTGPGAAAKRVALIIGNSAYKNAIELPNPRNDATDIAATLEKLDFDVSLGIDLSIDEFANKLHNFSKKLATADVALFFYAGHGLQFDSINYLLPVDARLENEFQIRQQTISLSDVLKLMRTRAELSIVFLDACRNNPFAKRLSRSLKNQGRAVIGRGLAPVRLRGRDILLSFATTPGEVAADGTGRNSPFTTALLKHFPSPGVEIEVLLKRVQFDVRKLTNGVQEPERISRLSQEFYFLPRAPQSERMSVMPRISPCQEQLKNTLRSGDKRSLQALMTIYPDTDCARKANTALAAILEKEVETAARDKILPNIHVFQDCSFCPEMVVVPAGSFKMGSPLNETGRKNTEGPRRSINFLQPFAAAKFEVTRGLWRRFAENTGRELKKNCRAIVGKKWKATGEFSWQNTNYKQTDRHPVACISYGDAVEFAKWLSGVTKHTYRLPSEAEWEYAARAGTETAFSTGFRIYPKSANYYHPKSYAGSSTGRFIGGTVPVGSYKPNRFGLHDMHGNVWEWTADCWGALLPELDQFGRPYLDRSCKESVMRGGAFWTSPAWVRSAFRYGYSKKLRGAAAGFRLVRELTDDDPQLLAARKKSRAQMSAKLRKKKK